MPTYSYSCPTCGPFDLIRPMAATAAPASCPRCEQPGRRVFGAPALKSLNPGLRAALDAQHRSSDAPAVVSALPPRSASSRSRRTQRRVTDPRQARLPRP